MRMIKHLTVNFLSLGVCYPESGSQLHRAGQLFFNFRGSPDSLLGRPVVASFVCRSLGACASAQRSLPDYITSVYIILYRCHNLISTNMVLLPGLLTGRRAAV